MESGYTAGQRWWLILIDCCAIMPAGAIEVPKQPTQPSAGARTILFPVRHSPPKTHLYHYQNYHRCRCDRRHRFGPHAGSDAD